MRRTVLPALATAALVATVTAAPARATTSFPGPGALCGLATLTDPNSADPVQLGVVFGGPLVVLDDSRDVSGGTLVCTVQVGEATHVGTDHAGAAASGTGLVVLPPSLVFFAHPIGLPVYVCTEFLPDDGSPTLYWNDSNDPLVSGGWITDPNGACTLAVQVLGAVGSVYEILNDTVCRVLGCTFTPRTEGFLAVPPLTR
jgi:hypothetical protein